MTCTARHTMQSALNAGRQRQKRSSLLAMQQSGVLLQESPGGHISPRCCSTFTFTGPLGALHLLQQA